MFHVHTKVDTCAKFQLSRLILIFISCYQLSSAVDSWWQLMWKNINWNFYVHTKVYTYAKFLLSRLILIFINFYQLLRAVDSWWQLIWKKNSFDFFRYTLKLIPVQNFSSLGWFSFSSTVVSCHQLLTADMKKFYWNFYVHSIGDIFAKFQLSKLIFIFIRFWQLISAVDN